MSVKKVPLCVFHIGYRRKSVYKQSGVCGLVDGGGSSSSCTGLCNSGA